MAEPEKPPKSKEKTNIPVMKNLELKELNVQELNADEMINIQGGGLLEGLTEVLNLVKSIINIDISNKGLVVHLFNNPILQIGTW